MPYRNRRLLALLLSLAFAAPWAARAAERDFLADPDLQQDLSIVRVQARKTPPAPAAKTGPRKAVWGIDVSHYQGRIRWDKVQGQSLSFVYMKATEGDHLADANFAENWQGATRAGLVKGAYHFFDLCAGGAAQAQQFIRLVPRALGSLPPAIDVEPSDSCGRLPGRRSLLRQLAIFALKVRVRYGKMPVVYVNHEMYDRYLKGVKHPYPIWISDYHGKPGLSDGRRWTFWQCSCKAGLRGISGPVDVDLYRGSAAQFSFLGKPAKGLLAGG